MVDVRLNHMKSQFCWPKEVWYQEFHIVQPSTLFIIIISVPGWPEPPSLTCELKGEMETLERLKTMVICLIIKSGWQKIPVFVFLKSYLRRSPISEKHSYFLLVHIQIAYSKLKKKNRQILHHLSMLPLCTGMCTSFENHQHCDHSPSDQARRVICWGWESPIAYRTVRM